MRPIDADKVVMHLNDYALQISPTGYETGSKKEKAEAVYETVQNCIKAVEEAQTVFGVDDAMKKTGECPDEEDAVITLDVDDQSYSEDSLRDMGIWNFADLVEAARNDEI